MKRIAILALLLLTGCVSAGPLVTPDFVGATSEGVGGGGVDTPTPFPPLPPTATPQPTVTPYVYATETYLDAVPTPRPAQFYLDRGLVGEYASYTFILMGSDAMAHRSVDLTDAFVVAFLTFPEKDKPFVSLVSIARDTYVYLPGYGNTRINRVWSLAGSQGLSDVLRYNFGLDVDGFIYTRMDALRLFIDDVLDGVTVNVPEPLLDRCGDFVLDMLPGPHAMDGNTAVCYARVRLHSSDYPRMLRQQSLLVAMRDKAISIAVSDPLGFVRSAFAYASNLNVATSFGLLDLVQILWPLATQDGLDLEIKQYRLMPPFSNHFDHPTTGAWLLAMPDAECRAWLMDQAMLGLPWVDASGQPLEGQCP